MTLISNNSDNKTDPELGSIENLLAKSQTRLVAEENHRLHQDIETLNGQIEEFKQIIAQCDREHAETLANYELMKLYVFAARDVAAQEYNYNNAKGALTATYHLLKLATEKPGFYGGNLAKLVDFPPEEVEDDDCYDCYDNYDDDEVPF